jgi:Phasin protein
MIMGKPQSRQPADGARARRRSLVELTAAMSRGIDESLLEIATEPVVVSRDDGVRDGQAVKSSAQKSSPQVSTAQKTTARMAVPAAIKGSVAVLEPTKVPACSARAESCDRATDLVAGTEDVQARSPEAVSLGVHAAAESTKKLARSENNLLEGTAAECHAVWLELVKMSAGATWQYTRELSRTRTMSELIELSSSHARRQCELVLQQARLLTSLAGNVTRPDAE